jgi:hypothetical protein
MIEHERQDLVLQKEKKSGETKPGVYGFLAVRPYIQYRGRVIVVPTVGMEEENDVGYSECCNMTVMMVGPMVVTAAVKVAAMVAAVAVVATNFF